MSTPYIGEIRMFGGNFAPAGWALCDGSLLPISENDALFALIGTTYGGDGQQTFAVPDLRGRLPVHQGTLSATGTTYIMGQMSGTESTTLTVNQIPAHTHPVMVHDGPGNQAAPANAVPAQSASRMYGPPNALAAMASGATGTSGGSQPHENVQPFLCVNFIISLFGVFPSQT
jgi:microcystin-dependent protein